MFIIIIIIIIIKLCSSLMQVGKLETELLRVSSECHPLQQALENASMKYDEELSIYKAMLQQIRNRAQGK